MSVYSVWLYFFSAEESHIILDRKLSDSSDNWRNRMWEKHTDSTSEYIFLVSRPHSHSHSGEREEKFLGWFPGKKKKI